LDGSDVQVGKNTCTEDELAGKERKREDQNFFRKNITP
jgi:hypothetical protein